MKTILYLIRHGQTQWNVERRMQGRMDSALTEKGIRMAQRLAETLPVVDVVYASPLGRTMKTARILFGGREVRTDDRLREIDLGEWEGRLQAELDVEDAGQHSNFWNTPHRFVCPGGENFSCVQKRAVESLRDLATKHAGQAVAVVSHTTVIRSMLFYIEPRPLSEFWNPPAIYPSSISEVHVEDGRFRIMRFGDIGHYDPQDQASGAY